MSNSFISLAYREAAVQQASAERLAVAMCDVLVADIQRAAEAMHRGAIEARSNALKHGFRVLGQLHAQVRPGTPAAANLDRFYTHLRHRMLHAQFQADPAVLEPLVSQILQVRAAFEQFDSRNTAGDRIGARLGTEDGAGTRVAEEAQAPLSFQA